MSNEQLLSNAWVEACIELWDVCHERGIDVSKSTIWDGFRYLYLTKVPDNKGRGDRGEINVTD